MSIRSKQLKNNMATVSHLEDLIENAAYAIFTGDPQGDITYINKAAEALSGYEYSELLGKNITIFFDDAELVGSPLRYDLLQQGLTVTNERKFNRKDRTKITVEMKSRQMPDGTYHTFMQDISERKEIEVALQLSEEKFSRAFMLSPDAININRFVDGTYLAINKGFTNIMGWTEGEVIGRSSLPGDLEIWCRNEDRYRLLSGLKENSEVIDFEAPFRKKNGETVTGSMSARVIEINGEECILSVTRDITERKKVTEELIRYRDNLQALVDEQTLELKAAHDELLVNERLAALGQLTATVSHELRNPLGTIKAALFSVKDSLEYKDSYPAQRAVELAERNIDRCVGIIEELNSYARGKELTLSLTNIDFWVKETIKEIPVPRGIKIDLDLSCNHKVQFDQEKLRQVIINLVNNAVHALQDEQSNGNVLRISSRFLGSQCEISIQDNGIGIPENIKEKVFEPLFSTKGFGLGLGMDVVKKVVEKHLGSVQIASKEGEGTTVTINFPIKLSESSLDV